MSARASARRNNSNVGWIIGAIVMVLIIIVSFYSAGSPKKIVVPSCVLDQRTNGVFELRSCTGLNRADRIGAFTAEHPNLRVIAILPYHADAAILTEKR